MRGSSSAGGEPATSELSGLNGHYASNVEPAPRESRQRPAKKAQGSVTITDDGARYAKDRTGQQAAIVQQTKLDLISALIEDGFLVPATDCFPPKSAAARSCRRVEGIHPPTASPTQSNRYICIQNVADHEPSSRWASNYPCHKKQFATLRRSSKRHPKILRT